MLDCEHPVELTTAEHLALSRLELAARHWTHGLHHLALAIAETPEDRSGDELLSAYAAAKPDICDRLPANDDFEAYYVACQAALLQRLGKLDAALDLLIPLALEVPDVPYLQAWALPWVMATPEAASRESLLRLLFLIYRAAPEYVECLPDELTALETALALFDARELGTADAAAAALHAGLLRKIGQFDAAILLARTRYEAEPTWSSAVAYGAALQAAGELRSAIPPLQHAAGLDPADISALHAIGEIGLQLGDTHTAREACAAISERDPEDPWSPVALRYCAYLESGDVADIQPLRDLLDEDDDALAEAAAEFLERLTPYVGYLPEPADTAAEMLREALADPEFEAEGEPARLTVHEFEAPSNAIAFRYAFPKLQIELMVQNIGEPDPRVPAADVTYRVWEYVGDAVDATPALPAPSPVIVARLALAARQPYSWERDWRLGRAIMEAIGPASVPGLVAAMAHPPTPPAGTSPLVWLPRIYQLSAFAIAHADDGWEGSLRRQVLHDLLLGPMDWSCGAAALALARLAEEDPERTEDVSLLLLHRVATRPNQSYCCYDNPVAYALLMLPDASEDAQEAAMQLLSGTA